MHKQLLIAGIDPGTTVGYAFLDINGKPIKTGSSRELTFDTLIAKTTKLGRVVVVGTDKAKAPVYSDPLPVDPQGHSTKVSLPRPKPKAMQVFRVNPIRID